LGALRLELLSENVKTARLPATARTWDSEAKSRYESIMRDDKQKTEHWQERAIPMKLEPSFDPLPFYYAIAQSHTVFLGISLRKSVLFFRYFLSLPRESTVAFPSERLGTKIGLHSERSKSQTTA
jgi:hypothetical protein